jgi:hypothetical protein
MTFSALRIPLHNFSFSACISSSVANGRRWIFETQKNRLELRNVSKAPLSAPSDSPGGLIQIFPSGIPTVLRQTPFRARFPAPVSAGPFPFLDVSQR